jgi:thioredoxin-like negative regulator of GroEL
MINLLIFFLIDLLSSSDVVELNSKIFKKDVLKGDNTYFVMFYTQRCGACHQMQPDLEKLATAMV